MLEIEIIHGSILKVYVAFVPGGACICLLLLLLLYRNKKWTERIHERLEK
jgi:hypothetical protein